MNLTKSILILLMVLLIISIAIHLAQPSVLEMSAF